MVYKYIRKSDRASWSEENLVAAVEKVKRNEIPLKMASKMYEIPYTTLRKHVQKGTKKKFLGRYKPVFDIKREAELVNYINKMDEVFFGLTKTDICSLAYKFAESRGIEHPFKKETAGDQWYTCFMLRHPEVRLTPIDRANIIRPKASYDAQIERFFEQLRSLFKRYKFSLKNIYNMGEICIHCCDKEPPRLVTIEDARQLTNLPENENEVLITTIFCCSAVGNFIPPVLIFPRDKYSERLSSDSMCMQSKNGCNNSDICLNWLKYLIQSIRPSENDKVLLILENHEWYKTVEFFDYAAANNVVILSLPHRCSHKLQPLHFRVLESAKSNFQNIAENCWNEDINSDTFLLLKRIFIEAYLKSVKLHNAVGGFDESGILKCYNDFLLEDCCTEDGENTSQTIDNGSFLEVNFALVKREKVNSIRIELQKKAEARRNRVIKISKPFSLKNQKASQSNAVKKLPKKSKQPLHSSDVNVKREFEVSESSPSLFEISEEVEIKEEIVIKEEPDDSVVQVVYELEIDF